MPRTVWKEWVGKTHDTKIPDRVRVRVFEHHGGICHLSGRVIRAGELWDLDHIIALANGGEHRESNLVPVLREPHRLKTREDVALKSKIYRKKAVHLGIKSRGKSLPGSKNSPWKRKLDGSLVRR